MPRLDLKANYMLLEPDAGSQMKAEKVLRKLRVDWDLACTVSNAIAQTKRLAVRFTLGRGTSAGPHTGSWLTVPCYDP